MKQEPTWVVIDVARAKVDIGVRSGGDGRTVACDEAEAAGLVAVCNPGTDCGGGDRRRTGSVVLASAAAPVAVVNPRQVCDLARGTGVRSRPTPGTRRRWSISPRRHVRRRRSRGTTCPGTGRHDHPAQPGADHAGGGAEPAPPVHPSGTHRHPVPFRLTGAGSQGAGRRPATDTAPGSGAAGETRPAASGSRGGSATPLVAVGAPPRMRTLNRKQIAGLSGLAPSKRDGGTMP